MAQNNTVLVYRVKPTVGERRMQFITLMVVATSFLPLFPCQPLPKRPMEVVLSSYLSAHLPLPCQTLHSSVDSTPSSTSTTKDQPNSEPQSNKTAHHPAMHSSNVSTTSVASNNKDDNVSEREASLSHMLHLPDRADMILKVKRV